MRICENMMRNCGEKHNPGADMENVKRNAKMEVYAAFRYPHFARGGHEFFKFQA